MSFTRFICLLCLAVGWNAESAQAPAAKDGSVSAAVTKQKDQVSQYGITWFFDKKVPVGQFVNGDYFVVGPVTVVKLDPMPLFGAEVPEKEIGPKEKSRIRDKQYVRNGSMLNPPALQEVAYDSGIRNFFKPQLAARLPIALKAGDSLVSTISLKVGEKSRFSYHGSGGYREHHDDSPVRVAAVLTCLAAAPPADAFRPAYGDRTQQIYLARNLRRDLLPALAPPSRTPDLDDWINIFQRPWVNTCFFGFEQPMENMPHYGQWVGQAQSMAGLLLMLQLPARQKERLLINFVQVGIDYWGLVRQGHPGWQGWGGHGSGRKFPIVLSGLLLGDEAMAAPTQSFPKVEFGEDNQTFYGVGWTGAKALFAGHSGVQSASGKVERPKWGPYEHLPPAQWTQGNYNSEAYRRANTSSSWVGQALVVRLMRAEKYWNHDAFLDYVDRWMTEDDREHRREILKSWPNARLHDKDTYAHQGNTQDPFIKNMWTKYRNQTEAAPQ